ncbi:hypothetical protein HHUSO_G27330 [Huso huso]|uniref:Uncharacterized protein n=1 Tax=Huso huso TaxID=61971 RepID=A0ABR0YK07_HUSHU
MQSSLSRKLRHLIEGKETIGKKKRLVKWLQGKHLLERKIYCPKCSHKMKMKKLCGSCDGWTWACRKHTHRGKKVTRIIRTKSQFAGSKSSLFSWMKFVYRFAQGLRLRQIDTIEDGIAKSSCTLSTMAKRLRVICSTAIKAHKEKNKMKTGGCQSYIVLDESKFAHKRKYGQGRYSGAQRRKSWVFGLLEVKQQQRRPVLNLESCTAGVGVYVTW